MEIIKDAEIAATVHYAAMRNLSPLLGDVSEVDVFDEVKRWKMKRRPPLYDEDIARVIRDLNMLGLIHARPSRDFLFNEDL